MRCAAARRFENPALERASCQPGWCSIHVSRRTPMGIIGSGRTPMTCWRWNSAWPQKSVMAGCRSGEQSRSAVVSLIHAAALRWRN